MATAPESQTTTRQRFEDILRQLFLFWVGDSAQDFKLVSYFPQDLGDTFPLQMMYTVGDDKTERFIEIETMFHEFGRRITDEEAAAGRPTQRKA